MTLGLRVLWVGPRIAALRVIPLWLHLAVTVTAAFPTSDTALAAKNGSF